MACVFQAGIRSIPAPAGEPMFLLLEHAEGRVYPRACGGTITAEVATLAETGLSPRLRGNPLGIAPSSSCPGSIPAPAGEPSDGREIQRKARVYPRACGGTAQSTLSVTLTNGLSPRLRGNLRLTAPGSRFPRSIPAPAGEPGSGPASWCRASVYPRACGGTMNALVPISRATGLSPRLRGNQPVTAPAGGHPGSIPAPAGEP